MDVEYSQQENVDALITDIVITAIGMLEPGDYHLPKSPLARIAELYHRVDTDALNLFLHDELVARFPEISAGTMQWDMAETAHDVMVPVAISHLQEELDKTL